MTAPRPSFEDAYVLLVQTRRATRKAKVTASKTTVSPDGDKEEELDGCEYGDGREVDEIDL